MQNPDKLRVLIVGAGEVGTKAAQRLTEETSPVELYLIERDEERFAFVQNNINCKHVHGSALDPSVLKSLDIASFDLFYAVTDSDEVNLLACQLAQEVLRREMSAELAQQTEGVEASSPSAIEAELILSEESLDGVTSDESPCAPLGEGEARRALRARSESGALSFFARVRSLPLYEHIKHLSPHTNILLPEQVCSQKIDKLIRYTQLFDAIDLDSDSLKLYGVKVHAQSPLVGRRLCDLTEELKITVAAMSPPRTSQSLTSGRDLLIPSAHDLIEPNSSIYFAATPLAMSRLHGSFCPVDDERDQTLVIAGDSEVACDVFKRVASSRGQRLDEARWWSQVSMLGDSYKIKLLEESDPYGQIVTVRGSITDVDKLIEVGVGPQATVLVCSHDEENLGCALLARELKCDRILIVNNREKYAKLISQLGFDGIFSPRQLAVNEIVHQTFKTLAQPAYPVTTDDDIEVRSFVIDPHSDLCGVQLSELTRFGFPREHAVIAAMIERDSTTHVMPTGADVLSAECLVYVVAHTSHFHRVKGLFGKRRSRFKLW